MMSEYIKKEWKNSPETPITAEELNRIEEAIANLYKKRSHIGMLVYSSTLDTMEKVIEEYGGIKWERIKGKFILGADDEKYLVGDTGGEEEHTLTLDEMPSHRHLFLDGSHTFTWGNSVSTVYVQNGTVAAGPPTGNQLGARQNVYDKSDYTGKGEAHNNMPPYIAEYIWHRVE